jgi:hypothetical protein
MIGNVHPSFCEKYLEALWKANSGEVFVTMNSPPMTEYVVTITLNEYGYQLKMDFKAGVQKRPLYSGYNIFISI